MECDLAVTYHKATKCTHLSYLWLAPAQITFRTSALALHSPLFPWSLDSLTGQRSCETRRVMAITFRTFLCNSRTIHHQSLVPHPSLISIPPSFPFTFALTFAAHLPASRRHFARAFTGSRGINWLISIAVSDSPFRSRSCDPTPFHLDSVLDLSFAKKGQTAL